LGFLRLKVEEDVKDLLRLPGGMDLPGPVATELNDWEHWDGRALDPADVASAIEFVVSRPARVEISDITVNSTDKLG
jgi:hypothetical protein